MIELHEFDLDEAINSLPKYQSDVIRCLLDKNGEEETAEIWINSNGPREIKHFGGTIGTELVTDKTTFWQRFKNEFDKFICGDVNWVNETSKAKALGKTGAVAIATYIAQIISPIIGIGIPILVPAIVLMMHVVSKATIRAYCANKNFEIKKSTDTQIEEESNLEN